MVAMESGRRKLESLNMDDLAEVINLYPWFGAARLELCRRMAALGGSDWGVKDYSDAAMYVRSRNMVSSILRSVRKSDYSDKDVENVLKSYIAPQSAPVQTPPEGAVPAEEMHYAPQAYRRTVRSIGGDFFSQEEYDRVRKSEDSFFSGFVAERSEESSDRIWEDPELGFCTETLARIYAEQGYFVEAKKIYSRLILRYPEKSAYFASLIEKLETNNIN